MFTLERGEFWGQFSFLKAGITDADFVTTVSPTYARETLTPEFGAGLEGVLARARRAGMSASSTASTRPSGIRRPTAVCRRTSTPRICPARPSASARCSSASGCPVGDDALARPVIGLVSRLVEQKGLDLIEAAADALVALGRDVGLRRARASRATKRSCDARRAASVARRRATSASTSALAHLVEAGADMFLMPSRFEPCGLNQMYSLRYGTVPIVHAVGGLDDTIQPYTARARRANGSSSSEPTADALARVVRQAVRLYHDRPVWRG